MTIPGKKGCAIIFGVIFCLILIFLLLDTLGNYCVYRSEPYLQASTSIEESKKKGIFVCTTTISPKILKFGNTSMSFEESWIEKQAHYASIWSTDAPVAGHDYQICFKTYSNSPPIFLNGVFMREGAMSYDILSESDFKMKIRKFTASLIPIHALSQDTSDEIPVNATW
jgi:hypothetical protein